VTVQFVLLVKVEPAGSIPPWTLFPETIPVENPLMVTLPEQAGVMAKAPK
jgi:hypothetical protein